MQKLLALTAILFGLSQLVMAADLPPVFCNPCDKYSAEYKPSNGHPSPQEQAPQKTTPTLEVEQEEAPLYTDPAVRYLQKQEHERLERLQIAEKFAQKAEAEMPPLHLEPYKKTDAEVAAEYKTQMDRDQARLEQTERAFKLIEEGQHASAPQIDVSPIGEVAQMPVSVAATKEEKLGWLKDILHAIGRTGDTIGSILVPHLARALATCFFAFALVWSITPKTIKPLQKKQKLLVFLAPVAACFIVFFGADGLDGQMDAQIRNDELEYGVQITIFLVACWMIYQKAKRTQIPNANAAI